MKKPALFIGRFQPFHNGHLDALKQISEKEDHVIIMIGSAEDDYVSDNPFSSGERYQMIEAALIGEKVLGETIERGCFTIVPIRNIAHYSLWVPHLESLLPPFGNIYTGSSIVKSLFEARGYKAFPIKMKMKISGTKIRELMLKNKKWEYLVPKKVAVLIKEWGGVTRLKEIQMYHK